MDRMLESAEGFVLRPKREPLSKGYRRQEYSPERSSKNLSKKRKSKGKAKKIKRVKKGYDGSQSDSSGEESETLGIRTGRCVLFHCTQDKNLQSHYPSGGKTSKKSRLWPFLLADNYQTLRDIIHRDQFLSADQVICLVQEKCFTNEGPYLVVLGTSFFFEGDHAARVLKKCDPTCSTQDIQALMDMARDDDATEEFKHAMAAAHVLLASTSSSSSSSSAALSVPRILSNSKTKASKKPQSFSRRRSHNDSGEGSEEDTSDSDYQTDGDYNNANRSPSRNAPNAKSTRLQPNPNHSPTRPRNKRKSDVESLKDRLQHASYNKYKDKYVIAKATKLRPWPAVICDVPQAEKHAHRRKDSNEVLVHFVDEPHQLEWVNIQYIHELDGGEIQQQYLNAQDHAQRNSILSRSFGQKLLQVLKDIQLVQPSALRKSKLPIGDMLPTGTDTNTHIHIPTSDGAAPPKASRTSHRMHARKSQEDDTLNPRTRVRVEDTTHTRSKVRIGDLNTDTLPERRRRVCCSKQTEDDPNPNADASDVSNLQTPIHTHIYTHTLAEEAESSSSVVSVSGIATNIKQEPNMPASPDPSITSDLVINTIPNANVDPSPSPNLVNGASVSAPASTQPTLADTSAFWKFCNNFRYQLEQEFDGPEWKTMVKTLPEPFRSNVVEAIMKTVRHPADAPTHTHAHTDINTQMEELIECKSMYLLNLSTHTHARKHGATLRTHTHMKNLQDTLALVKGPLVACLNSLLASCRQGHIACLLAPNITHTYEAVRLCAEQCGDDEIAVDLLNYCHQGVGAFEGLYAPLAHQLSMEGLLHLWLSPEEHAYYLTLENSTTEAFTPVQPLPRSGSAPYTHVDSGVSIPFTVKFSFPKPFVWKRHSTAWTYPYPNPNPALNLPSTWVQELKTLWNLRKQGVASILHGFYITTTSNQTDNESCIQLELCCKMQYYPNTLEKLLNERQGDHTPDAQQARLALKQTVFADLRRVVESVHLLNLSHSNLKPSNVLLDENLRVCLSDFKGTQPPDMSTDRAALGWIACQVLSDSCSAEV